MIIDKVNRIIKEGFDSIQKTDPLLIIEVWSKLFNNGEQCRMCIASQKKYYSDILTKGIKMAEEFKEIEKRTCVPTFKGLKYVAGKGHFLADTITDEDAIEMLEKGILKESDFKVLPEVKEELTDGQKACVTEFKERLGKGEKKGDIEKSCEGVEIDGEKATKALIKKLIKLASE